MQRWLWLPLAVLLLAGCCVSLALGPQGLDLPQVGRVLFGGANEADRLIVIELRLPRTLLAVLIGGGLALSGAALQGFLRNPLGEPGIFGISGAAALGAVLVIYSGLTASVPLALPLAGLTGAALAVALVLLLAGRQSSTLGLVLAGVAVAALAGALTSLALNLAPSPFAVMEIVFWLLGSLADRSLDHLWLAAPFMLVGGLLLLALGRTLDALTLGEDAAQSLGLPLGQARLLLLAGTGLVVGAATSVAGAIGFVGLVVPHLLRPICGQLPSRLLPISMLGGAVLLVWADSATRLFPPFAELKLGVITALLGAPFFLWLVVKMRREAR